MILLKLITLMSLGLVESIDGSSMEIYQSSKSLHLEDKLFNLAVRAVELLGSRKWWERAREKSEDKFINDIGMINAGFEKEFEVKDASDSYTNWRLEDSMKEIEGRQVLEEYLQNLRILEKEIEEYKLERGRSRRILFNREAEISELCSGISGMSGRELGIFFQYCYSLINDYSFLFKLRDLIARRIGVSNTILVVEEGVLKRIEEWIDSQYNMVAYKGCICTCCDSISYCGYAMAYSIKDRNYKLCAMPIIPGIKLLISYTTSKEVKKTLQHLSDRLGRGFPIVEIELESIDFNDLNYPLSIFKSDILKYTTRINFTSCKFKDEILRLHPEEDRNIMKNILALRIFYCDLLDIKTDPELLEGIEALEIYFYIFTRISYITYMKSLRRLIIEVNSVFIIIPEIYNLDNLRVLKIYNYIGQSLEDTSTEPLKIIDIFTKMKNLEVLVLSSSNIYIDEDKNFVNGSIRYLSICGCFLTEIPPFVYSSYKDHPCLPKMEVLMLASNEITDTIFTSSNQASSITDINISYNKLNEIPSWILSLKSSLKVLDLSNNSIESIPDEIITLDKLEALNLNSNRLVNIPEDIYILSKLTKLYLGNNNIITLPGSIWKLTNLEALSLSYNHITEISDNIKNLSNLHDLWLNNNQLTKFPEGLKGNINLEHLYIYSNHLEELPSWIEDIDKYLPSLRRLYMKKNNFSNNNLILEGIWETLRTNDIEFD